MELRAADGCACLFCGGRGDVRGIAREDGAAVIAVCAACRAALAKTLTAEEPPAAPAQAYSEAARRVMAAAREMTEEAFETAYLQDITDRIIFEYVRGYGQTALDANAAGLLSIMTEKGGAEIAAHLERMLADGLLYPVAGKEGWYGADYPFADD